MIKEQKTNPIGDAFAGYRSMVTSPGMQAALLAGAGIPIAYMLKRPVFKGLKSIARDPRAATALGVSPGQAQQGVEQMQQHWVGKHAIPLALGLTPALLSIALTAKPSMPWLGQNTWQPMNKKNSLAHKRTLKKIASLWQAQGYQPQIDFSKTLNPNTVIDMLKSNPYMQGSPYERYLGTSILAASRKEGQDTTLGGIYDSALNKFQTKLQYQGVADKAIKGLVSGSLAGMFTDVVGAVIGLPDPLRGQVANSVGFGKALYSILS